jgi:hypothetical protein
MDGKVSTGGTESLDDIPDRLPFGIQFQGGARRMLRKLVQVRERELMARSDRRVTGDFTGHPSDVAEIFSGPVRHDESSSAGAERTLSFPPFAVNSAKVIDRPPKVVCDSSPRLANEACAWHHDSVPETHSDN